MKIYTKSGDDGTTGLFAGPRVEKDHPRIAAYGTVDELNAFLGMVVIEFESAGYESEDLQNFLLEIQGDLFSIGAELATPNAAEKGMCLLESHRIEELESWIDRSEATLQPLTSFILPGGSKCSSILHLARTVCRRAEREVVSFSRFESIEVAHLVRYLNRLSDLLFVLARVANNRAGLPDITWNRPGSES